MLLQKDRKAMRRDQIVWEGFIAEIRVLRTRINYPD
tara:strand:+ start:646 stop:753 length:108 start_codon:yes stop_codon:yes gene_type:complete